MIGLLIYKLIFVCVVIVLLRREKVELVNIVKDVMVNIRVKYWFC